MADRYLVLTPATDGSRKMRRHYVNQVTDQVRAQAVKDKSQIYDLSLRGRIL